ncbi:MAG: ketopantoate reductase family protein [Gracilibacteraceae bacterium]|jgi:2-dehydropantoate 2-reductase|nr:ketopantoate reductase family protein [Gracilibacteraceae bacterium]
MRIAVIGAGSMGTIIGAYLTKAGCDVLMYDANKEHVAAMQERGATIKHVEDDKTFTISVKAFTPDKMEGIYDLVFLLNKQTTNPVVLPNLLKYLNEDSIVCALQNGIPEPSVAETVGQERTIGGAMLFPGTWLSPGVSAEIAPYDAFKKAAFDLGELSGGITPRIKAVATILDNVGKCNVMEDLMDARWTKLLVNASGSGLSAALNCTYGEVIDNPKALTAKAIIAKECLEVCHAEGHKMLTAFDTDIESLYWKNRSEMRRVREIFFHWYDPRRNGKASMLQDLEKKLPTEIDFINGHVAAYGRKHGIATPVNTRVVELVKEAEARKGVNDMGCLSRFDDVLAGYEDIF